MRRRKHGAPAGPVTVKSAFVDELPPVAFKVPEGDTYPAFEGMCIPIPRLEFVALQSIKEESAMGDAAFSLFEKHVQSWTLPRPFNRESLQALSNDACDALLESLARATQDRAKN